MKYFATLFLFCSLWTAVSAQTDTLQYDGLSDIVDGKLIAVTRFPGELDVIFNTRFTPAEKCTLSTVLVGFSVVKFQALTGNDTLIVFVFENGSVPPSLVGLQKTYKVNLGDAGFPNPNIRFSNPLEAGARDVLAVKLNPPIIFSPRRDFVVGVKLQSTQKLAVGQGLWNGLSMVINPGQAEFDRSRRYMIAPREEENRNDLATQGASAALFLRAIVGYNPNLPVTDVTDVDAAPAPVDIALEQNYPNPFNPSTTITYTLDERRHVRLAVCDALGREARVLADGMMDAGRQQVNFDAADLPGGMYMLRLTTGGRALTRKMILLK
ncbi:MAG: T9SS type A sorting domain-containing protein [Bacteroidetes bacterium]|nr:T9SS type A sorting domain-containing protein [Bacteroidota bacterium]